MASVAIRGLHGHGTCETAQAAFRSRPAWNLGHGKVICDSVLTPYEFTVKWRASALKESSAAQEHFIDLCRLLDEPTPTEADRHRP